jgi:hypothetical protein
MGGSHRRVRFPKRERAFLKALQPTFAEAFSLNSDPYVNVAPHRCGAAVARLVHDGPLGSLAPAIAAAVASPARSECPE